MGILGTNCVCLLKNKMAAESNLQMVKMKTMTLLLPFYFLPGVIHKMHYSGISLRRTRHKADTSIKRTLIQGTDGFLVNFSQASLYKADNYKADIL